MKISEAHLYEFDLPVKNGPYRMADSDISFLSTIIVKLVSNDGIIGWGETCPLGPTYAESHAGGAIAALKVIAADLVGTDVLPNVIHNRMDRSLNGHNYAKSAIDIAAYDLIGKKMGLRVSDLLGGALTDRVPSYYATIIGHPDETARIAADKVAEGYPRLQVKVGGREIDEDIETINKVWEKVRGSHVQLAVDANRNLLTRDAIRLSRDCRHIPFIFEQPCESIEDLRKIRPLIVHPIYMDESSVNLNIVVDAIASGLVDGFGMKVSRLGGLHRMQTFRELCAARKLPHTCDDSWGGDIVAAACVHIGATVVPGLLDGVWIAEPYVDGHFDERNGISVEHGYIRLPNGPGLGISPNEAQFGDPVASF